MGSDAKYMISGSKFKTKAQIVSHVQGIFKRYQVGEFLRGDDFEFVVDLLSNHRRAEKKIGCGVLGIRVDVNGEWKNLKMFTVVRLDDSETDFSYRKCISPLSKRSQFNAACRESVVDDILAFKRAAFNGAKAGQIRCNETGEIISWDRSHVDHCKPWTFAKIVDAFIQSSGIDVDSTELSGNEDRSCRTRFADGEVAVAFRNFHNSLASLRMVTPDANLRMKRITQ